MKHVYNKIELQNAIKNNERMIVVHGEMAAKIRKAKMKKKAARFVGGALAIGGLAAIPFTGGTSAAATAAGVTALTAGAVSISTTELIFLLGATVAILGISKGYNVRFNSDGSVVLERK